LRLRPTLLGYAYANGALSRYTVRSGGIYYRDRNLRMNFMIPNFQTTMYANGVARGWGGATGLPPVIGRTTPLTTSAESRGTRTGWLPPNAAAGRNTATTTAIRPLIDTTPPV